MSPAAVAAAAGLAVWVWVVGSSLAPKRPPPERIAWGVLGACALAWTAMAAGAFGAGVLGTAWAPAGVGLLAAAGLVAWRRPDLRAPRPALVPLAAVVAAALVVSYPVVRRTPPELWPSHGDMLWHMGWTRQLYAGYSSPGGMYAHQPNGYPWLFHALTAWIARALPGGPGDAVEAMQVLGLAAAAAGMWLLAGQVGARRGAAAWSTVLFLCAGGIGAVKHPDTVFETHMHGVALGPFHGDPVPAMTPGLTFLPPMIPRDLGLALAPTVVWIALRAARGRPGLWWCAGAAAGLVFLVAPLAGIFSALWGGLIGVRERRPEMWRAVVAGAATTAVWLVPLGLDYRRYHGFASVTLLRFVEPTAAQTVLALGLTMPLGIAGLVLLARRGGWGVAGAPLLIVLVPAVAVAGGALATHSGAAGTLLHGGGAPAPLVRWLRYVPFLALALCPPAGIAADAAIRRIRTGRLRPATVAVAAVLGLAAAGSTAAAALAEWRVPYPHRLLCTSLPAGPRTRIAVVAREPLADDMAEELFMHTGASFSFVQERYLKIRFRGWLAGRRPGQAARRRAVARALRGGPPPAGVDLLVVARGEGGRPPGRPVASCTLLGTTWDIVRAGS